MIDDVAISDDISLEAWLNYTPKQQEFYAATWKKRFVLFGGARGGGKSDGLRKNLACDMFTLHAMGYDNVVMGLFTSTYKALTDRHIGRIQTDFPSWMGELKETKANGLGFYFKPEWGEGIIKLRNLDDPSKYKGSEFAEIAVDELTENYSIDVFDTLRGSLRASNVPRTKFMAATNPDGPGNQWVRELWIENKFPKHYTDKLREEFLFIPALPQDNPYLNDDYWEDLKSQPEDVRKAWLEGDWYAFSGRAFKDFGDDHITRPWTPPPHWKRGAGLDWGSHAPYCYLLYAKDPDTGRRVYYKEVYMAGLTPTQQTKKIQEISTEDEVNHATFADPSMWGRTGTSEAKVSLADIYINNGILLTKADNNRIEGKRKVDQILQRLEDGKPGVQITENCTNLIMQLRNLVYDKRVTEDVDSNLEDHAYDAFRYSLTDYGRIFAKKAKSHRKYSAYRTYSRHF